MNGFTSTALAHEGTQNQAIGGLTTKILVVVDALGNLVRFVLLPGQRHDIKGVKDLIADVSFKMLLADKAFDVEWLRSELEERSTVAAIPPKTNRTRIIACDFACQKWQNLVDDIFCSPKNFAGSPRGMTKLIQASSL